jgi:GPI-anchor transamidase subunit S
MAVEIIAPVLQRLSPVHNFSVESQLQFQAPLAFEVPREDDRSFLTREQLTVFVNSAEWTVCELFLFLGRA